MRAIVLGISTLLLVATLPASAPAQSLATPTGATRPSQILDRLHHAVTKSLPSLPPAPGAAPAASVWVPDRYVTVPGVDGFVHVPAHWEQRTATGEHHVPPLPGTTADGRIVQFPGGTAPAPEQRQSP